MANLNKDDLEFIITSLEFTEKKFKEYSHYPSYEFKREQINRVNKVKDKIINIKRGLK